MVSSGSSEHLPVLRPPEPGEALGPPTPQRIVTESCLNDSVVPIPGAERLGDTAGSILLSPILEMIGRASLLSASGGWGKRD